jgi:Ca2+-binding RTX toxin-like protein
VPRQGHLTAAARVFLMGCAVFLVVGCAEVGSRASQGAEQGRTEATKEHASSPEATASEEAKCGETRTIDMLEGVGIADSSIQPGDPEAIYVTNDMAGCPSGGLLSGTDKPDQLAGEDGEDEVRGLGGSDRLSGGRGSDVVYGGLGNDELEGGGWHSGLEFYTDTSENVLHGGPGRDILSGEEGDDVLYGGEGNDVDLWGSKGEDVLYGGDGNDHLDATTWDKQRDELYCGEGLDTYSADEQDYVDSSCEVKR